MTVYSADFGPELAGKTVGVTEYSAAGAITVSRTVAGVVHIGDGFYIRDFTVNVNTALLKWDAGDTYAYETLTVSGGGGGGGLDAAGVRAAIGLASANLDAQLLAIDDYLDTEIAAIKAKTDNLPADPASNTQVNTRMASFVYTAPDNAAIAAILTGTGDIQSRLPTTLIGGKIDANVGTISNSAITAASIAASALDGKGNWNVGKTGYTLVQGFPTNFSSMDITVGGAITAGTVLDKASYNVSSIDAGVVNATVAPNLDAAISSRMATFTYTAPPTVAEIRSEIDTNSVKLDVAVSTRLATTGYIAPDNTTIAVINTNTSGGFPSAAAVASQVRTELTTELSKLDATVSSRLAAVDFNVGGAPSTADIVAAIRASTNTLPLRVNTVQVNDVNLVGDGTVGNPMRGA